MPTVKLALIRHGPTAWNEERRIQGSTDIPLSESGRGIVRRWRAPSGVDEGFSWVTSPLARARETAEILNRNWQANIKKCDIPTDERIREMNWGEWEGCKLDDLRLELGPSMTQNEARGLDFRPPGGESPRGLQGRLFPWLKEISTTGKPVLAVTHHGVIRALYSLATGWDMTEKRPLKFHRDAVHFFRIENGVPMVECMNVFFEV